MEAARKQLQGPWQGRLPAEVSGDGGVLCHVAWQGDQCVVVSWPCREAVGVVGLMSTSGEGGRAASGEGVPVSSGAGSSRDGSGSGGSAGALAAIQPAASKFYFQEINIDAIRLIVR